MPSTGKKAITLKDIAEKTGYSITAVSRALKDMSDISENAKQQIKACASEMGYIGNFSASSLRTGKSNTVAVLVGDLANPHFSFLAKKVQTELSKSGYSVFIVSTNESLTDEREAILMACSRNIDGIILCPVQTPSSTENIDLIRHFQIPFVLVGRRIRNDPASYVIADDRRSGYLLGKHITSRGHSSILYVNTQQMNSSSDERIEGFYQAIEEADHHINVTECLFDDYGMYMTSLFHPDGTLRFTAAVAFNDMIAWDIMCRLNNYKKKVPDDLSLAGFDNLHAYMPLPFPLTSVSSSPHAIPKEACRILLKHIENPQLPEEHVILDIDLHDRNSILPIPIR